MSGWGWDGMGLGLGYLQTGPFLDHLAVITNLNQYRQIDKFEQMEAQVALKEDNLLLSADSFISYVVCANKLTNKLDCIVS